MKIRVYYEDTDCGNVVYYANYLKYMERGRTELMRDRGIGFSRLHGEGILFVVVEAHIKYHASAHYDEILDVDTAIQEHTPASITFSTMIRNNDGTLLVSGDVRVACVSGESRIRRMPQHVLDCLSR